MPTHPTNPPAGEEEANDPVEELEENEETNDE